jgi:ferritin-like metal-binding protein YciE
VFRGAEGLSSDGYAASRSGKTEARNQEGGHDAAPDTEGLIEEGKEIVSATGDPVVKDAALISAAQRVEHYEISAYGTARTLADELDLGEAKDLLDQALDEESNADKLLTKIATGGMFKAGINQKAPN